MSAPEGEPSLVPEPAAASGTLIGYGRVSTAGQVLDRQLTALDAAGCTRIFTDVGSGRDQQRPRLIAMLDYARPGDLVVVTELARLGRSLSDLIDIAGRLRTRGVGLRSLKEAIDTSTPGGRLVFHIFASLAEFVRELIVEGTVEGLQAARSRGARLGRPPALTPDQVHHARAMLTRPEHSVAAIARLLGVSRTTVYKAVPELAAGGGGRPALTAAVTRDALARHDSQQLPGQGAFDHLAPSPRQEPAT
ncbi:recombinase family protein [Pseudonocardia sp. EC080619-01]|uniref:recombinase family protein n=1 Tax=Pseudonocardia sp. EC080619-01 TaxID=1096856 RepID=UPI000B339255|nr:recombinase family protein [Pseudonocardia sp. EC080619-01]